MVLLIDNFDSFTYNVRQCIYSAGMPLVTIVTNTELDSVKIEKYSHVVIGPGPKTPQESGDLVAFIQNNINAIPMLGICLGHQAIAVACGGNLYQLQEPKHGSEAVLDIVESDAVLFQNIEMPLKAGLYHSWAVQEQGLPFCLRITSYSSSGVAMSLSHSNGLVHGVQFHPESYRTPQGVALMKNFMKLK